MNISEPTVLTFTLFTFCPPGPWEVVKLIVTAPGGMLTSRSRFLLLVPMWRRPVVKLAIGRLNLTKDTHQLLLVNTSFEDSWMQEDENRIAVRINVDRWLNSREAFTKFALGLMIAERTMWFISGYVERGCAHTVPCMRYYKYLAST